MERNTSGAAHGKRQTFIFLEGVRGLGALQVMVVHYISSFLPILARVPGTPHYSWELPLSVSAFYYLIDGSVIVFVFFLVSAFVLAQSYLQSDLSVPRQAVKRFVRLFLPTFASALFAILLICAFPQPREWIAGYAQSTWAEGLYVQPMNFAALAKDAVLDSMIIGYQGASLFDPINHYTGDRLVSPLTGSMNPPLWTLHAEFWGSLLVLFLAYLYKKLRRSWFWTIFGALFFVTGSSHFTLFLIGFAVYLNHARLLALRGAFSTCVGLGLLAASVFIAVPVDSFPFDHLLEMARKVSLLQAAAGVRLQNEVAGLLLFGAIMLVPQMRRMFSVDWAVWVGRCSYGLYLVHFPIMFTVGYAAFSIGLQYTSYGGAIVFSILVGGSLSLIAAKLFERWIDRKSLALSTRLVKARPRQRISA